MIWIVARVDCGEQGNRSYGVSANSLTAPSLDSMTLDEDDVDLARMWLRNRRRWGEREVISQFETEFARWNGSKYAFAFMGGRVALSACIYALNLQPGNEVILPGYTCVVVPNAFHYAGIKTVYSDIELDTYGLDAGKIEDKITAKTRAVLLHHLYGLVCRDYEAILDLAKRRDLRVIEDCAHATGAEYKGLKVGNRGDVGIYSSEQSKVFNTIQGGMAVTNDDALAQRLKEYYDQAPYPDESWIDKQLHNVILNFSQFKHPQRWWRGRLANILYGHKRLISTTLEEERGIRPAHYGRKMPTPIAALGINQLKKIDLYNKRRRQTAKEWDEWCDRKGYQKPYVAEDSLPVFLRYPVLVEPHKKQDTSWARRELGVDPGVWFVSHIHPVDWPVDGCQNADKAVQQCINLPCLVEGL